MLTFTLYVNNILLTIINLSSNCQQQAVISTTPTKFRYFRIMTSVETTRCFPTVFVESKLTIEFTDTNLSILHGRLTRKSYL